MNTAVNLQEIRIKEVIVTDDAITAYLVDGRVISVPLALVMEVIRGNA